MGIHKVYKRSRSVPQMDPVEAVPDPEKFMAFVFAWLSGLLAITALFSVWFSDLPHFTDAFFNTNNRRHISDINTQGVTFIFLSPLIAIVLAFLAHWKLTYSWIISICLCFCVIISMFFSILFAGFNLAIGIPAFLLPAIMFFIMMIAGIASEKDLSKYIYIFIMSIVGIIVTFSWYNFSESRFIYKCISYMSIFFLSVITAVNKPYLDKTKLIKKYGDQKLPLLALLAAMNIYFDAVGLLFVAISVRDAENRIKKN